MKRILGAVLFLGLSAALAVGQQPPPGTDQVGSDHNVGQGEGNQQPSNNPRSNADVTNTNGSSHGRSGEEVFAGQNGSDSRTNQMPDTAGQSREAGVAASRRDTARRDGEKTDQQTMAKKHHKRHHKKGKQTASAREQR